MTTFRLARTELRRLTSGKLPRLALVAITLVPLLYGAMYLLSLIHISEPTRPY